MEGNAYYKSTVFLVSYLWSRHSYDCLWSMLTDLQRASSIKETFQNNLQLNKAFLNIGYPGTLQNSNSCSRDSLVAPGRQEEEQSYSKVSMWDQLKIFGGKKSQTKPKQNTKPTTKPKIPHNNKNKDLWKILLVRQPTAVTLAVLDMLTEAYLLAVFEMSISIIKQRWSVGTKEKIRICEHLRTGCQII